jgi:hypothetical protein
MLFLLMFLLFAFIMMRASDMADGSCISPDKQQSGKLSPYISAVTATKWNPCASLVLFAFVKTIRGALIIYKHIKEWS